MRRRSGLVALTGWPAALAASAVAGRAIAADPLPRVSLLSLNRPEAARPAIDSLLAGLRALGQVEGRDFVFEGRFAYGDSARMPALAQELVRSRPAVVVAGFGAIPALAQATTTIPIVMWGASNPVEAGWIRSLSNPGGNLTGITYNPREIGGKIIDVVKTVAPHVSRVALVWNPDAQGMIHYKGEVLRAAAIRGVTVTYVDLRQPADYRPELLERAQPDALFVAWDSTLAVVAPRLIEYANAHRLPTIGVLRQFVEMGGLMSLGPDPQELVDAVTRHVDRILKGASPATLPVEQPSRYQLVVSRKAAKAIGLALPQILLLQATEVIE